MAGRKPTDKKLNQGFSLITVIIAVSFIGILGMLLLYISVANFQMKSTDMESKDGFYTAERALEEIRTGLQEDVGGALSRAYVSVMETYNRNVQDQTQDEAMDVLRQNSFRQQYVKELADVLKAGSDTRHYSLDYLKGYVDITGDAEAFDDSKETLLITTPADAEAAMISDQKQGVVLKNLKVIYVDARGAASVIETDIRLAVPNVQFPTPSTLPDLMNMIVVADGGIVCGNTNAAEQTTIQGSVYAGLVKDTAMAPASDQVSIVVQPGARLLMSSGDKVVCQGEIRVDKGSAFESGSAVTLWAQGITLAQAEVSLLGKTYLADDVTVETGNSSTVTIRGEFYGYGSPQTARSSYNAGYFADWTNPALSSAIVINGKNTTLDLSGTEKMMLSGNNYIAGGRTSSNSTAAGTSNVLTGESLTVKGTQLAYLAPAEIFSGGTNAKLHNPMSYDEYLTSGMTGEDGDSSSYVSADLVKWTEPVELWGGRTLADIGVDSQAPLQKVFYNNNAESGGGYVYFYLNFSEESAASAFMESYYENNPAVKASMDKYLSFYFGGENTGIRVNDPQSYLRYVTNGNVLSYDSAAAEGALLNPENSGSAESLAQEQINYQNMWYTLNRKMIGSYDLLKEKVRDSDKIPHDETDSGRSVFDNLVNEKEMISFIEENHNAADNYTYHFKAAEDDGGLEAVMFHNGASSTILVRDGGTDEEPFYHEEERPGSNTVLRITADMADKLRLVVCTGDVEIGPGVKFQGIIMAKGKITLGSGATLLSAPLEAAKVFQAQMNSEKVSPKDFFWEGDKYVLGNSTTSEEISGSGRITDIYEVADCVLYENWAKK